MYSLINISLIKALFWIWIMLQLKVLQQNKLVDYNMIFGGFMVHDKIIKKKKVLSQYMKKIHTYINIYIHIYIYCAFS